MTVHIAGNASVKLPGAPPKKLSCFRIVAIDARPGVVAESI